MRLRVPRSGEALVRYKHRQFPVSLRYQRFEASQSYSIGSNREEQVLVLLSGEIAIEGSGSEALQRKSVFEDPPAAVYVGKGRTIDTRSNSRGEFMVVSCRSDTPGDVRFLTNVPKEVRGKEGFRRSVRTILPEQFPANRLVIGETINEAGNWSSFPPHKHDENSAVEAKMQEVYFFKINPENGFGFQRIYDDLGLDETFTIQNNDLVWIPRGYHPVAVMPGYQLYYLWALAGEGRQLKLSTDERFRWLL